MQTPPAPRDAAQKWLAFGAIAVVAVGVSFGSNALKSHLQSTLPQPDPTAAPVSTLPRGPNLPNIAYETDDEDEVEPAEDPIPPPGSVRVDRAAIPTWGALDARVPDHQASSAPVHSKAAILYRNASAFDGDLVDAFVVCRARVEGGPQGFPTVRIAALLGRAPEVAAFGPKDAGWVFVSSPLTTIRKRDPIEIRVFVASAQTLEPRIGKVDVYGEDFPPTENAVADLDCRALANEALQTRVAQDAARADAAIATLTASARVRADLTKDAWGYPTTEVNAAERAVGDVAALVGWADPRVKKRVTAVDAALGMLDKDRARAFADLRRSAGTSARIGTLRATLRSLDCTVARDACRAVLVVKNEGTEALTLKDPDVRAAIATKAGPMKTTFDGDLAIAPGASADAALTGWAPRSELSVAQVCAADGCAAIRLR